ncbi:MAG: SIMPL domain-containing protein [Pirellulales bacterium]|nr:SIMPL domain-containing protein [Pirellulales bacterium]
MAVVAILQSALVAREPVRSVRVSAKAEIAVVPDEVLLTFSIDTENKDLLRAKAENDKLTRAVLALGPKHGLPAEQLTMTGLDMGPRYERRRADQEPVFVGYEVSRSIEVSIRDFTKLEPVLADALAAGVTNVGDLLFRTRKHHEYQVEAREKAVGYAREKARHLAELNGLALGEALEIVEDVEGDEHTWGMGGMGGGMAEARPAGPARFRLVADEREAKGVPATASGEALLAPGTITIRSTVTITYEMHPRPH